MKILENTLRLPIDNEEAAHKHLQEHSGYTAGQYLWQTSWSVYGWDVTNGKMRPSTKLDPYAWKTFLKAIAPFASGAITYETDYGQQFKYAIIGDEVHHYLAEMTWREL